MSTLVIDYDSLSCSVASAGELVKKAEEYAERLRERIQPKFKTLTCGENEYTVNANYYIQNKVDQLNKKHEGYAILSGKIASLVENAKRIDKEVATAIVNNKEEFIKKNEHLRIDDWKVNILNFLTDIKNSCSLFEMIGNGIQSIRDGILGLSESIKYWYKCEGGKETLRLVFAIGGAIAMVALAIASFPASGFFAVCAAIGAVIGAIHSVVNLISEGVSYAKWKAGDPAWAKIYGDQNSLTDFLRRYNFGNSFLNSTSNVGAALVDGIELFCNAVNLVQLIGKFKSSLSFVRNYLDDNIGLRSYMKTAKWIDVSYFDDFGNFITEKVIDSKDGIIQTRFTFDSVWKGLKAFVLDKPLYNSEIGIRTLLNQNLRIDFIDWTKSFNFQEFKGFSEGFKGFSKGFWKGFEELSNKSIIKGFSEGIKGFFRGMGGPFQAIEETFKYTITEGGRLTFSDIKNSINIRSLVDTARYNLKHGFSLPLKDGIKTMIDMTTKWEEKRKVLKAGGDSLKGMVDLGKKIESMFTGKYSITGEVTKNLAKYSEDIKIADKVYKVYKSINKFHNNYIQAPQLKKE